MYPRVERQLGRTDVWLTQVGLGGGGLGNMGGEMSDAEAAATIAEAWGSGIRYFDTAPYYGFGISERRTGDGLRDRPHSSFVLSTKVGRLLRPPANPAERVFEERYDYGYRGMMRSFEDSIQRLLLPSVDLAIIHDLDLPHHSPQWRLDAQIARLATDGWHAVEDLKRAGLIRAIGMGVNDQALIPRFLELFDVDFFLLAGRYTLLEQNSLAMLDLCHQRGVGIVVGGVLRRGLLLTGSTSETGRFAPRAEEVLKAGQLQAVCKRHGVHLPAAALQFPLGHPAITSVLVGALAPDHVRSNIESFSCPIPPELWLELKAEGLMAEAAPAPEQ